MTAGTEKTAPAAERNDVVDHTFLAKRREIIARERMPEARLAAFLSAAREAGISYACLISLIRSGRLTPPARDESGDFIWTPEDIERARQLRGTMTDAEVRLWIRLRGEQVEGYRFRRQVALGQYIADFACMRARLVVEVDGGQHAEQARQDARRTAWLSITLWRSRSS